MFLAEKVMCLFPGTNQHWVCCFHFEVKILKKNDKLRYLNSPKSGLINLNCFEAFNLVIDKKKKRIVLAEKVMCLLPGTNQHHTCRFYSVNMIQLRRENLLNSREQLVEVQFDLIR